MTKRPKFIIYLTQTGQRMKARVFRCHRDGSFTVEPRFWQDAKGQDTGCCQGGHKLRVAAKYVEAAI